MSAVWKQPPPEVLKHWIEELQKPTTHDKLTDWEKKSVASIDWQFWKKGTLTRMQCETVERIYADKT